MSDILFPAQLFIPICTVTEGSCELVCCRESLTNWATGTHGRFRNAHPTRYLSYCVTRVSELRMENPLALHTRDNAPKVTDAMLTNRDHEY